MTTNKFLKSVLFATSLIFSIGSNSEETVIEKAETVTDKAVDSVRSTYRGAKDKTCEMINGKMECMGKKLKNKMSNMQDKVETKATETKNKID